VVVGFHPDSMLTALVEQGMVKIGALLDLDPSEAHHLQVRRASSGDQIRLLDGVGGVGSGILSLARTEARVEVIQAEQRPRPPTLALAVGAGDRERFGWLAEKAAELGVTDLLPLETERTVNVSSRVRESHIEKLQARALDAIKQSGAPWAPAIHPPARLISALGAAGGLKVTAEQGSGGFPSIEPGQGVTGFIGPEGGWTPDELTLMREAGCRFVGLGSATLRFETAALAFAVRVQDRRSPA
jgi:16S rRNA (uracil1498-N3)-methyltransferase